MIKNIFLTLLVLIQMSGAVRPEDNLYIQPINNISVTGNKYLGEEEFFKLASFNIRVGQRLDLARLEKDLAQVYQTGFFAAVSANYALTREGLSLRYQVKENPSLESIVISGNVSIPAEEIIYIMKNKKGALLNFASLKKDIKIINRYFAGKGYGLSQVKDLYFDNKTQTLYIIIQESLIEKISIQGLQDVDSEILSRELNCKPGDIFNSQRLREDRENLLKTRLLGSVSAPVLELGSAPGKIAVIFKVKERKPNQINFGYGITAREHFGFVKLTLLNFFKSGETMSLRVQNGFELGEEKQTYRFRLYSPWFAGRKNSIAYERYFTQGFEELVANGEVIDFIEISRVGWLIDFGWINKNPWAFSTEYKEEDITEISSEPRFNYTKKSLALVLAYNSVSQDDFKNSLSGEYWNLRLEGGGTLGTFFEKALNIGGRTFSRFELKHNRYVNYLPKDVLAIRFFGGIIRVDETTMLEGEQYVVGGTNTVRGYLDIYPFSIGTRRFTLNLELRHKINEWLQTVLFYDTGTAFDLAPLGANKFYSGKGLGVRFGTPIGQIRFDWAFGESYTDIFGHEHPADRWPRNILHFSLGQTF